MIRVLSPVLWLVGIFSHQKSFRRNPLLGSRLANRAGLHVFRVVAARVAYRLRLVLLAPMMGWDDRRAFARDGYLARPEFLSAADFDRLCHEVDRLETRIHEMVEGDTLTQRIFVDTECLSHLPTLKAAMTDRRRTAPIRYATSKNRLPLIFIENLLRNAVADGDDDPQSTAHTDTFHSTIKGWLFLDDVTDQNGPFTYVPGSHRLTAARLGWEYRRSIVARDLTDGHSEDGSFRYESDDIRGLGCGDPIRFTVPANTLVIADTFGVHWRAPAAGGARRRAIWFQSRDNPFSPFITPLPSLTRRINEFVVKRYLARFDRAVADRDGERVFKGRLSPD
ncbi:MAG: phytanoyl-CoA dioxygenase family protein [Alphaproteobacteria bacterium]